MKHISNEFVAFRVPSPVKERIEQVAAWDGLSVSDICRRSVLQTLREHEENNSTTDHPPGLSKDVKTYSFDLKLKKRPENSFLQFIR